MTHVIETERLTKSYGTHRGIIELDLAVEEGLLRVEVVVERAARGSDVIEDVLDAHPLVAMRLDTDSRGLDEGVSSDRSFLDVDRSCHGCSTTPGDS